MMFPPMTMEEAELVLTEIFTDVWRFKYPGLDAIDILDVMERDYLLTEEEVRQTLEELWHPKDSTDDRRTH